MVLKPQSCVHTSLRSVCTRDLGQESPIPIYSSFQSKQKVKSLLIKTGCPVIFFVLSPGKRGHIVADTLLPMMFLRLRKLGNICCGHKMFLNKIKNIFCVPDTKFVSATNLARARKRGNIFVGSNVSATICPRLPGP